MKNLINKVQKENAQRISELKAAVNKCNTVAELTQYAYTRQYITKATEKKGLDVVELKKAILSRFEKLNTESFYKKVKAIEDVFNAPELVSVKIVVEWAKSKTWGMNPTAEALFTYKDAKGETQTEYLKSRSVTGCGFDKLSTSVAEVLNASLPVKKVLYKEADRSKNQKLDLREIFGYGSGYRNLPYFEGGVGVNCFPSIFEKVGFKMETIAGGKSFNVFTITKK